MWRTLSTRPPESYLAELLKKVVAVHNGRSIAELASDQQSSIIRSKLNLHRYNRGKLSDDTVFVE